METSNPVPQHSATEADGKTVGIISYMTIIGWLVAYFALHKDKKTAIGSYQLRQTLLFYIVAFAANIILSGLVFTMRLYFLGTLNSILWVGFLVLWIIGLIGAINGEKKPMPLIGEKAQTMFPDI